MVDKSELVAFERKRRLYRDAYVDNFRSVRHFPSLTSIGAGRAGGNGVVFAQEPQNSFGARSTSKVLVSRLDDVSSRLIPPDTLEEIFDTAMPLTTFRSAIMCKHTKARQERRAAEAVGFALKASPPARVGARKNAPSVFNPTSKIEAKAAIQHKVVYDGQPFRDKPHPFRSNNSRTLCSTNVPPWRTNNRASSCKKICNRPYFNVPLESPIKADRKYTQEFICRSMDAYRDSRCQSAMDSKGKMQRN